MHILKNRAAPNKSRGSNDAAHLERKAVLAQGVPDDPPKWTKKSTVGLSMARLTVENTSSAILNIPGTHSSLALNWNE